jgi:hypothetical protein
MLTASGFSGLRLCRRTVSARPSASMATALPIVESREQFINSIADHQQRRPALSCRA